MKKSLKKGEQKLIEETAKFYQSVTHDSMDGFWVIDMKAIF
jgi:hypothetical protein